MRAIIKTCLYCSKEFPAMLKEIKRGNGKYCSKSCSARHTRGKIKIPNTKCSFCEKPIYRSKSRMNKRGLSFCSREHKDIAQRIMGGIKEMHLPHYGTTAKNYRLIAFRNFKPECVRCGYAKSLAALQVHHKDEDRSNNSLYNLEILCANCHSEEHYSYSSSQLRLARHCSDDKVASN